jgi:predicted Zn-ribbon and HTH transcriptional regulator
VDRAAVKQSFSATTSALFCHYHLHLSSHCSLPERQSGEVWKDTSKATLFFLFSPIQRLISHCITNKLTDKNNIVICEINVRSDDTSTEQQLQYIQIMDSKERQGVGLRPLACWNCGFESRRGHGCLSLMCVLSGRGLCVEPIPRPEMSYRVWCV